jgi:hypothetical protein
LGRTLLTWRWFEDLRIDGNLFIDMCHHEEAMPSTPVQSITNNIPKCKQEIMYPASAAPVQTYVYRVAQRQETLDLPYLTLLCDNLKKWMFLQNFFSWHYFGNLLCFSNSRHHSTILQTKQKFMPKKIRLLGL